MVRHSPAELYIKFLFIHLGLLEETPGTACDQVKQHLLGEHLDPISEQYLSWVRSKMVPPKPFEPKSKYHVPSQRFLTQQGILKLFFRDQPVKEAFNILHAARPKEFVETMILSEAPPAAIAKMVTKRYGLTVSAPGVCAYKTYFWNIDLVDSTEIRTLIRVRGNPQTYNLNPLEPSYAALESASYNDPRRLAADLPNSPFGALLAQMRLGFMPSQLELAKVLQTTQHLAALRTMECAAEGGYKASSKAMEWSIVAKNVSETLNSVVTPEAGLRDQLQALLLKTDSSSIPVLAELSSGSHTVEIEAPAEEEHVSED